MTKVLFILDCLYANAGGGTEKQFLRLYRSQDQLEIDPDVAFLRYEPIHDKVGLRKNPTHLGVLRLLSWSTVKGIIDISRQVDENAIRVIQSFFDDAAIFCALLKVIRPRLYFICSQRNMALERNWLRHVTMKWVYRRADKIVANSGGILQMLQKNYSLSGDKIRVIDNLQPESAEIADYSIVEDDETLRALRTKRCLVAMVIANLRPIKGIDDLLQAAMLLPTTLNLAIVVIGNGDKIKHYRSRASALRVSEKIYFLGYRHDASGYLKYADMAILPSRSEGGSNALIEYMRAGLPIVATDTGGNTDFIAHGQTGLLVATGDPQAMVRAVTRLANDNEFGATLGSNAKRYAQHRFNNKVILDALRAVYERTSSV